MKLKITGRNVHEVMDNVGTVLNIAVVVFGNGVIPTPYDIENAENHGRYWVLNAKEEKYEILQRFNNHKAFIREQGNLGKRFMVIEFYSRYIPQEAELLSQLLVAKFDFVEEVK